MSRAAAYFRRLHGAPDEEGFRKTVEEAVQTWNHESSAAFARFWPVAVFEQRRILIRSLRALDSMRGRSAVDLLCVWSHGSDRALKIEILECLAEIGPAPALWRLWSIYRNSTHRQTREWALRLFTMDGTGLFFREALSHYDAEDIHVRALLLEWASRIPILDDEEKRLLTEALRHEISLGSPQAAEGLFRRHQLLCLRHGISVRRLFGRYLKEETRPADRKEDPSPENQNPSAEPHRMRAMLSPDVVAELVSTWEPGKSRVSSTRYWENFLNPKFDPSFGAWDPSLRQHAAIWAGAHLSAWTTSSAPAGLHLALDRLRGFDLEVFGVFVSALPGESTFFFKQTVLDHLLFWRIPTGRRQDIRASLKALLSDETHVKIFATLARFLVLHFGDEGLQDLLDSFEYHADPAHSASLLKGLLHALREDGALSNLSSTGRDLIARVAAHVLRSFPPSRPVDAALWERWCRLVTLVHLEECHDALLAQVPFQSLDRSTLAALIALDSEPGLALVAQWLVDARTHPSEAWETAVALFGDLAEKLPVSTRALHDAVLEPWMNDDDFRAELIHYLAAAKRSSFRSQIPKLLPEGTLLERLWALEYLAHFPPETFYPEIRDAFLRTREAMVCDRAALRAAPAADDALLTEILSYYITLRGEYQALAHFLASLRSHPELLDRALHLLLSFRHHPRFKTFVPLLRFFLLSSEEESGDILPLDSVLLSRQANSPEDDAAGA